MALYVRTLDELEAFARGALRGVNPLIDVGEASGFELDVKLAAALAALNQQQASWAARQLFVRSCDEDMVAAHARRYGLAQAPATKAEGWVTATAVATGTTIPAGALLDAANGQRFAVVSSVVTGTGSTSGVVGKGSTASRLFPASGVVGFGVGQLITVNSETRAIRSIDATYSFLDLWSPLTSTPAPGAAITPAIGALVNVRANDAGAVGSMRSGDVLTFAAPPSGVTAAAVVAEVGGGADLETIAALRVRVSDEESSAPAAGNNAHVRKIARETPNVRIVDAVVFPGYRGPNTVDVFLIGPAGERRVPQHVVTAANAYLAANLSWNLDVAAFALDGAPSAIDIDTSVTTELGYERDFISTAFTTTSGSTTTRIVITTAAPASIVGRRVAVNILVAGRWGLYQRTVAAVGGVGPYYIDVTEPMPVAPASGEVVVPGGPLLDVIDAAVTTLFESFGPGSRLTTTLFERYPSPAEAWPDTFTRALFVSSLMALPGVSNVVPTTPASDPAPTIQDVPLRGRLVLRFKETEA